MTVASSVSRTVVSGNGSATSFAYTFPIESSSHLVVVKTDSSGTDTTLVLGTHYSVSGVGSPGGGSITYPLTGSALASGERLTMRRVVPLTQTTDLTNQGAFYSEVHEDEFDLLCMADQQLQEQISRAIRVPTTDTATLSELPNATTRAGKYLFFSSTGQPTVAATAASGTLLLSLAATGDGSTVAYSLPASVPSTTGLMVSVDGAVQTPSSYSVSGSTLTFTQAPPLNSLIDVRIIGATVPTVSNRLESVPINVKEYGAAGDGSTDDTAAFQSALATGRSVYVPPGVYKLTDSLELSSGQWLFGAGVDTWDHLDAGAGNKRMLRGSHLLFSGTGTKDRFASHNNAGLTSGGVVTNPDTINVNDATYSLYDFMNADATTTTPATKKLFSAGVYIPPYAANAGLRDLRVMLNYNGIAGYTDSSLTGLGDSWDVGVYIDCSAFVHMINVQVVGYWRIAGLLCTGVNDQTHLDSYGGASAAGRLYHTHIDRCIFQGWCGVMIRGGSVYKSTAVTASTITIPWDASHPFAASGSFKTPKGTFTYTSWSKSGSDLIFAGVSPDPSAASLGTGPVRTASGNGMGGMSFSRSLITGLDHSSGTLATNTSYLNGRVSKALEIDGSVWRHLHFDKCYVQSREDVLVHLHNIEDLRFHFCQFESNSIRSTPGGSSTATHGGRFLASPQDISNPITTASGDTEVSLDRCHVAGQTDLMPHVARGSSTKFASTTYLFNPRRFVHTDVQLPDDDQMVVTGTAAQNVEVTAPTGKDVTITSTGYLLDTISTDVRFQYLGTKNFQFRNAAGTTVFKLFQSGNGTVSGNWNPEVDNSKSLGTSSLRWSALHTAGVFYSSTVSIRSGTGTPEGAVSAAVGSVWLRTDGGASTSLYIKESGSGNTGWVAK